MINTNFPLVLLSGIVIYLYYYSYISSCSLTFSLCLVTFLRFFLTLDCDIILRFHELFGKNAKDLKGKVIWITGASSGIGEKLAFALSKGQAKLILSARSEDKLKQVKQRCLELGNLPSDDVLVLSFDMTDYEKHEWALSTALKHFGQLDVLVSNAGRGQRAEWKNIETSVDRTIFDLNLFSLVSLSRFVTKHFLTVGKGHHVVMSSIAGKIGAPFSASYTGSKHALNGYFECLRAEKGSKGISVTILCPGPVESNLMEGVLGERLDQKMDWKRSGKMMSAERCAELSVVALVNKLSEAWIAAQPVLTIFYVLQYQPTLLQWAMNNIDFSALSMKLRDGSSSQTHQD